MKRKQKVKKLPLFIFNQVAHQQFFASMCSSEMMTFLDSHAKSIGVPVASLLGTSMCIEIRDQQEMEGTCTVMVRSCLQNGKQHIVCPQLASKKLSVCP